MLLHDADSPAPRCLRMFLLEKGLALPSVHVDVFAGENRQPPFLAINPAGQTPALQCDDGRALAEAVAIAEYVEELHPEPPLIGRDAAERAQTRQWWRRVELNVTEFIHNAYHYAEGRPRFESRIPVAPEAAAGLKRIAQDRLAWLERLWGDGPYLCGARFSAADIWLYVWLEFGNAVGQPFDRRLTRIAAWFDRVGARPAAGRSRRPFAAS
ncbi:glutathione S-transferase family protein [Cognatiluteimonas weifangensis]|uniref:Glutathione S-transferase family protein n=1 Tax=Cognatiluteimonas weifangensis TaxID=2303539 RepID=A0A372DNF8_9GAMM|nr:glutathione S-transferase family protein [Luteimonas weifangensis]RFP60872.1 glutathione S-transferase family protein [Luteimonas weifangensis]